MATSLVPILVKLGKNAAGQFDWPDFDAIDASLRRGMHWPQFIDTHGIGWQYARELMGEEYANGLHKLAGTLVPPDFAAAAVALHPDRVEALSEAEWTEYFEQRVQTPGRDEILDAVELQALAALAQLDQLGRLDAPAQAVLEKRLAVATDPNHCAPGIRVNPKGTWSEARRRRGVSVDAAKVAELKSARK